MSTIVGFYEKLFFLYLCVYEVVAYNILGVFPIRYRSHSLVYNPVMRELAKRGHNVTSYSVFLQQKNDDDLPNFRQIDLGRCFPPSQRFGSVEQLVSMSRLELFNRVYEDQPTHSSLSKCEPLGDLLRSEQKFDLLITEPLYSDLFTALGYRLNIPASIHIFPGPLNTELLDLMGSPSNPSYMPERITPFTTNMNFVERVRNVVAYVFSAIYFRMYFGTKDDRLYRKMSRLPDSPPFEQIRKNATLILANSHFSLNFPMPLVPGIIEIGGVNLQNVSRLPENLELYINESEHGVIYFSMGSLLKSESFKKEKLKAFLYAFSKIPQRVLWKWGDDDLPGKSDNVMVSKWMPQRDILAHPNVKLFISHGGLMSTSEAVYEGVPVLGIPVFADQGSNIKSLEEKGAGEFLNYNDISKEIVLEKIRRLVNDPKYRENAKQLSIRYRDRPMSPLDTAVYWAEYAIRNKGRSDLKSAAVNLSWYQYLLFDVIAFLIFAFASVTLISYFSIKIALKFICNLVMSNKNIGRTIKFSNKEKRN